MNLVEEPTALCSEVPASEITPQKLMTIGGGFRLQRGLYGASN